MKIIFSIAKSDNKYCFTTIFGTYNKKKKKQFYEIT